MMLTVHQALDFITHARRYKLWSVVATVEQHLNKNLKMDHVFQLLPEAHKRSEVQSKHNCTEYIIENYHEFLKNQKNIEEMLGMELFYEVVSVKEGIKEKYTQGSRTDKGEAAEPRDEDAALQDDLQKMFTNMHFTDAHVKLDGKTINFHRTVAGAYSESLHNALTQVVKDNDYTDVLRLLRTDASKGSDPKTEPLINFTVGAKGKEGNDVQTKFIISEGAFVRFLEILYRHQHAPAPSVLDACSLIPFTAHWGLKQLQEQCEAIVKEGINAGTALAIIGITKIPAFSSRADMKTLQKDCYKFLAENLATMNLHPLVSEVKSKENKNLVRDTAVDILEAIQQQV